MTNTLLKITNLSLSAFRGIPGVIELDLSAPLTIIYAPNGTGKTSCIDAAEWLLTDEIKRLSQFIVKNESCDLRCKFALQEIRTKIVAQIEQGKGQFQLSKTLDSWILGNNAGQHKTSNAILKALAPNAVDETTDHRTAPKMRKIWLRGTRFLTESDLSTLIDTSPNTKEARRQILSDLMGVRELDDRANEFRKFSDYLKTGYRDEKGIAAIEKELKEKVKLLEKVTSERRTSEDGDMDIFQVVVREMDLACSSITGEKLRGTEIKDFKSLEACRADLMAKYQIKQKYLEGLTKALEFIEIHWPEKETILTAPETLAAREKEIKNLSNEIKVDLDKKRKGQASLKESLNQKKQEIELLSKADMKIKEAIFIFSSSHPINLSKKLRELLQAYSEIPEDEAQRAALLKIVERVKGEFFGVIQVTQNTAVLKEKLHECENTLKEDDLQKIQGTLGTACEEAKKAEKKYLSASGPLEQLKLATKKAMEIIGNTTVCPVCNHNWETSDELKTALASTIIQVAPLLVELKNEESAKKRVVLGLESELKKAEEAVHLRSQIAENEESIKIFFQSFSALKPFFDKSPLDAPKDFEAFLRTFPKKLTDSARIYELRNLTSTLKKFIQEDEKNLSLQQIATLIGGVKESLENEAQGMTTEITKIEELIKVKQNELKDLDSESEATRKKLLTARSVKNSFWENWNKISEHPETNEENFTHCKVRIKKEKDHLLESERHLTAGDALMNDISRGNEISALREEIDQIKKRLRQIKSAKEKADNAIKLFEERSKNYCREQIEKLSNVMFSIFGRIQANEIFDSIKGGAKEDPFEWIAKATEHEFIPSKHFSMGQRQDLALSIFLARARGLGGTFFLDEPIIHLDDLNRVALLDMLRVLVVEKNSNVNLVVTTASRALVRHLQEKFSNLSSNDNIPPLRVLELEGTPRTGVKVESH